MTLRDKADSDKLQAHRILDLVRAGQHVSAERINWALAILGDSA
jgi:hypothetical protein